MQKDAWETPEGTQRWNHQSSSKMSQPLTKFSGIKRKGVWEEQRLRERKRRNGKMNWEVAWSPAPEELNSLTNPLADEVVHSSLSPLLRALGQICNHSEVSCPQNPNKYNSLCNLKRKQRHLSIPACQRLAQHLSQALPNLLLSQFHFKPFSRLKDEILQETIKHWTRSTLKPCNENYKRNSKYSGSEDQIFPASPKVNKLFLLRAAGGEHRQPKIVIYFSCKPFLTSRKPRMEIKEVQPDPSDFSSSPIYFKHHQLKGQWWH